jgi:hypothetical protein
MLSFHRGACQEASLDAGLENPDEALGDLAGRFHRGAAAGALLHEWNAARVP